MHEIALEQHRIAYFQTLHLRQRQSELLGLHAAPTRNRLMCTHLAPGVSHRTQDRTQTSAGPRNFRGTCAHALTSSSRRPGSQICC